MAEMVHVGCRIPEAWERKLNEIAEASGRKQSEVLREALAQYLGENDPAVAKSAITDLQERVSSLENKLAGLGKLIGQ